MLKITKCIKKLVFLLKLRRLVPLNFLTLYNEVTWLTEVEREREGVKNKCIKGENSPGQTCWILIFSNFSQVVLSQQLAMIVSWLLHLLHQQQIKAGDLLWLWLSVDWVDCYSCYTGNESKSAVLKSKTAIACCSSTKNKTNRQTNNNKNKNQWVRNKQTKNKRKQNKHEANKNFRNKVIWG